MKKKPTLLFLLLIALKTFSQENYNPESYNASRGDLEASTFKKDSTANALVIYEYGNSYVDKNDYNLRTEVREKIKILNREGFDKANIAIHLYNNNDKKEEIKNIVATTYNITDGKAVRTKLLEKNIFREKYDENHTLVKFTLPNIKEGSVIAYSYELISPFMYKYKGWEFQSDIPKLHSEYRTSIPGNWQYNIKLVGEKKLFSNVSAIEPNCLSGPRGSYAKCVISKYIMKDIPAFIEEEYMTTKSNYLSRIEYELKTFMGFDGSVKNMTKTWKTVDNEIRYKEEIGRQLKKKVHISELLNSEITNAQNALKKAKAIYRYVQDTYAWNGDYRIFQDASLKDLLKNKSGNVSSINILLHNLLNETGIKAKPVLLSTRKNGLPTTIYPVISDFNYLIVLANINEKNYLLDATDDYLSFGEIPFRCLNKYGRLLDFKNGSDWININPNRPSVTQYKVALNLGASQNISGEVNSKSSGYHALKKRKSYFEDSDSYIENLQNANQFAEISDHTVTSEEKNSPNFLENYKVQYISDEVGDNIYINPFFVKFFKENPFKLQERTYPIDFGYASSYFYTLKLDFGDNYVISEKPKDLIFALPNQKGQVLFTSTVAENYIQLFLKITYNDAVFEPEYYPYLKEYMNRVVDLQNNSIILLNKK